MMDLDDLLIDYYSDVSSDDEPVIMSQAYSMIEKYHKKCEGKYYLQLLFNDLSAENLQGTLQYLLPAVLCADGLKLKSGYDVDELFSETIDILKIDLRQIASIILNEDLTNEGKINVVLKLEEHGWLRKEDSRFFPVVSSSATSLLEKIIKGEEAVQRFKEKKAISLPMSPEQDHLAMLTFNLIYDIIMKITKNKGDAVTYNQIVNEFNSLIKNNTWRTNYAELKLDENPTMNKDWFKHYTTRATLKKFVEMTKFSGIEFIPENASFRIRNNSKKFELDKWTNKMENQENVKREINNYIVDEMPKQNEPKENKEPNPESQIRNDSIYDSDDSSGNGVYSDEENEDNTHKKIAIKNQKPEISVATSLNSKKPSKINVFLHQNVLNVSTSEDEGDDTRFSNEEIRTEGNSKVFDVNRILYDDRGNENAGKKTIQNENVESKSILSRNSNTGTKRVVSFKERDSDVSSDSTKSDKRLVSHNSTSSHMRQANRRAMSSERNNYDFSNRSTSSQMKMANRERPPERNSYDLSKRSTSSHTRQADREMQRGQNNYDFSNRFTSSRISMANREMPSERNNYDLSNCSTSSHISQADRAMPSKRYNYDFSNRSTSSQMNMANRDIPPGRNNYDFSNHSTSSLLKMANRERPQERSYYDLSNHSTSSHMRQADRRAMSSEQINYDFSNRSTLSQMKMTDREIPPERNSYELSNHSTSSHMVQADKAMISLPMSPEQDHLAMLAFNLIYDIIMKITKNKGYAVPYNQIVNEFNSLIKNNTWRTNYAELKLDENPTMNKEWFKHYTTRATLKKFVEMTKFSGIELIPENGSFRIRNNSKKFELDKWTNLDSQIRNDSDYSSGIGVYSDEGNEDNTHKKITIKKKKPEIPVATSPNSKKPSKNNVFLHQNYLNGSEDKGDDTIFSNEEIRTEGNSKVFDVNRILYDDRGNENAGNTTIQNENVESRSILSRNSNTVTKRVVSFKERDSDVLSDSTKSDKRLVSHNSTSSHMRQVGRRAMSTERNNYDFSNRSSSPQMKMANRERPPERNSYDLSNRSTSSHTRQADREMQLGKNNYDFSNNSASSRISMANRDIPPGRNNYDLSNRSTSSHMSQADRAMSSEQINYDFSNRFTSSRISMANREMPSERNNYDFSNRSTSSQMKMANKERPPERNSYDLSNRSTSSHMSQADRAMPSERYNYDFSNRFTSSQMNMANREIPPERNNYDLLNRSTSSHMRQTNRTMSSERNNYEDPYEEKPWPSNRFSEENTNRNRQYNNDYEPHSYSQQSGTYRSNNRDTYKLDSRSYTSNANRVEAETMSPGERKNIEKKYEMIQNDEEERHELEKISRERRNRYIDGIGYSQLERNRDSIPPAESSRSTISQNRTPRFSTGRIRKRFESQDGNL